MKSFRQFIEENDLDGHSIGVPYKTPSNEPVAKYFVWVQPDNEKPKLLRIGDKSKDDSEENANAPDDISNKNTTAYWKWKIFGKVA